MKTLINTLANLSGQLINAVLTILLVPFYIRYLDLEGYGLIGFFTALVALLGVFTNGIGAALMREIALRDSSAKKRLSLRRLIHTYEVLYWGIGAVLGLVLAALSGLVSNEWVQVDDIPTSTIQLSLLLISLTIAISLPRSVYEAVLIGTQHQVLENVLNSLIAIATALSGVVVILIWQSVPLFYASALLNSVLAIYVLRRNALSMVPASKLQGQAMFDLTEIRSLLRLSLLLIWTNGIGVIIRQIDRIAISRLLPVASLGVYNAGISGGRLMGMISNSFLKAVSPETMKLGGAGEGAMLRQHLLRNSKVVGILSLSLGLPIFFFAPEILEIWTGNAVVVREGSSVMAVYGLGMIFISLARVFYQGQLAMGRLKYSALFNTIALAWFPLTVWILVDEYGIMGAALAWLAYSVLSMAYHAAVTLGVLLKGRGLFEFARGFVLTGSVALLIVWLSREAATLWFPGFVWGRVALAGLGCGLALLAIYILSFGLRLPTEIRAILSKPS